MRRHRPRAKVITRAQADARALRRVPSGRTATEFSLMDQWMRDGSRILGYAPQDIPKGGYGWITLPVTPFADAVFCRDGITYVSVGTTPWWF